MKKALRGDANTARWLQEGGAKNFHPTADTLPGGTGRPKFNHLEMVTTFTYRPSLAKIDACNFELSWQETHPHTSKQRHPPTHTQTDSTDCTIHCAAAS